MSFLYPLLFQTSEMLKVAVLYSTVLMFLDGLVSNLIGKYFDVLKYVSLVILLSFLGKILS